MKIERTQVMSLQKADEIVSRGEIGAELVEIVRWSFLDRSRCSENLDRSLATILVIAEGANVDFAAVNALLF